MEKTVKPMEYMVLFKQIAKDDESGIIVPENAKRDWLYEVMDVGDKVEKVNVGDYIVFRADDVIRVDGHGIEKGLFLIDETVILAKIQIKEALEV